ncbi:MAG TPA: hypothetical protein VGT98_01820 [Candidatus Elarobacter sp.]|nr:hypothetical protein [Candidatus Elarobacter sp.]
MKKDNPYGDDAGTRVGRPDTPKRDNADDDGKSGTGAGSEAARGIQRGIHEQNRKGSGKKPGSEPLQERETEHESGYGGEGGTPRTSSDQR